MKRIYFLALFSGISFASFSQETVKATSSQAPVEIKAAAIVTPGTPAAAVDHTLFLTEESFDFGKIPQGKPVTHVFQVKNMGAAPLTIANVQASCGCTTPVWEKDKAIAPNETTDITVGYNAAAEGPFTKLVTVTYGENLSRQITIKGEVWKTPAASAPVNSTVDELKN